MITFCDISAYYLTSTLHHEQSTFDWDDDIICSEMPVGVSYKLIAFVLMKIEKEG